MLNLMQVAQSKVGIKFIAASYKQKGESQKREAGATGEGESTALALRRARRGELLLASVRAGTSPILAAATRVKAACAKPLLTEWSDRVRNWGQIKSGIL